MIFLTFLYEEQGWFNKYPQGLIEMMSTADGIWSVPVNIHRSNVMWYLPETLDGLGVAPPATWDDFLAACPTIEAAGLVPLALAQNWTHNHLWESVALGELGVEGWNALWAGEKAFTDPDVVAVWDKFGEILACTNDDAASLSWQQASDMVANGEAAFNVMGDWANGYFATTKGLEPDVDYGWVASPGTDGVFMALSDAFGLPQNAPNRENVLNWLRLMGSVEGQDLFNPFRIIVIGDIGSTILAIERQKIHKLACLCKNLFLRIFQDIHEPAYAGVHNSPAQLLIAYLTAGLSFDECRARYVNGARLFHQNKVGKTR